MLFASIVVLVAYLVWMTVARVRRITVAVVAALVLLGAATVGLAAVAPRATVESRLLLCVGALAALLVGREAQRRNLGEDQPRWRWPFRIAVGVALIVICGCSGAGTFVVTGEPFVPSVEELGELPEGLTVQANSSAEGRPCGSGACYVSFTVRGRPGEPADRVARRMRDHLVREGWRLDSDGQGCRPIGWLMDPRTTCVAVSAHDGVARVSLEGGRAHP